jgi:integral membrane protein
VELLEVLDGQAVRQEDERQGQRAHHAYRTAARSAPLPRYNVRPMPSLLRATARLEALSFLVLLGIAMPLKHLAGHPGAVKVVGWIHGVLFVAFCLALLRTMRGRRWPLRRAAFVFVVALVPFGPFVFDRRIAAWEAESA